MKGFVVPVGFMGYVGNGKYIIFPTEQEYYEWAEEVTNYISKEEKNNGSSKEV